MGLPSRLSQPNNNVVGDLTVAGLVLATATTGVEHILTNTSSGDNTLAITNLSISGYSAIRFLSYNGIEECAIGYGNVNGTPTNAAYYELSMLPFTYASAPDFYFIQTTNFGGSWSGNSVISNQWKRMEVNKDGRIILYRPGGAGTPNFPTDKGITLFKNDNTELWTSGAALFTGGNGDPGDGTPKGVRVGYDQNDDSGFVECIQTGVATKTLYVNRNGGDIRFGGDLYPAKHFVFTVAGKGIYLKSGTGARGGEATLSGGTVTVTNTTVSANTKVLLTRKTAGGTTGKETYTVSAGASFTINSDSGTDTSTYSYFLIEVY